ncbi:MAG TPA: hypothetical protein VER96_11660 [Polyangiaceae bacterium]|nr:hypothetical protein [Polyangiaceae bacterium]
MRRSVVCASLFLCASVLSSGVGCVGHAQDAHEPGDRLGTYHATGKLVSDSCQAAVLGVTSDWQFDVKLSRQSHTLYWLNGAEAIPGTIASDNVSFGFESGVQVTLQAARGAVPGCVIERSDNASGKLSSSSTTDVQRFNVDMSFTYAVQPGSLCAGFVGVEDGFAALPCKVSYSLTAERTALPPSLD